MCIFGFGLIRFQATLISEKFSAGHNSCHKSTSIKETRIAKSSEISKHLHKTKKNYKQNTKKSIEQHFAPNLNFRQKRTGNRSSIIKGMIKDLYVLTRE